MLEGGGSVLMTWLGYWLLGWVMVGGERCLSYGGEFGGRRYCP